MRWSSRLALAAALALGPVGAQADQPGYGIGRPPTEAEIDAWNIDVRADGQGLPAGHGSVAEGAALFAERCQSCHLDGGSKALAPGLDILVGRTGTLKGPTPGKTIGTYWPFATTLFDFIRRAMPFPNPQSLTADQVYALCAFLLNRNGIVPGDAVLDAKSLPAIRMPNRDGFNDRDDWRDPPHL